MHKLWILLVLSFSMTVLAEDKDLIICPLYHASSVKKIVEASGSFDKFKHCGVSCLLTLRCLAVDVMELGVLKEIVDMAGPGNAEMKDIIADADGIALVTKGKAKTDKACLAQCHVLYPQNSCQ